MDGAGLVAEDELALLHINTICVLSTLMPDGSPYASAAHFATDNDAHILFVSLHDGSQTASNVLDDARAAITIGSNPGMPATLQMRGLARVLRGAELELAQESFYSRFPHSARYRDDRHTLFVGFRPVWSRYSDPKTQREFFVRGFKAEALR